MNTRQKEIMRYLEEYHEEKLSVLSEKWGVSGETIRRDVSYLEQLHLVRRVHGKVICESIRSKELTYEDRGERSIREKKAIGRTAAALVQDGESLAVSGGTTGVEFVRRLKAEHLTIFTNSVDVAVEAVKNKNIRVYLTGGLLRREELSLSGSMSMEQTASVYVDKLFFSFGGISPEFGITDYHVEESLLVQHMMKHARTIIGMSDSPKTEVVAFKKICDVGDLDILIVDWHARSRDLERYREAGIRVFVAEDTEEAVQAETSSE